MMFSRWGASSKSDLESEQACKNLGEGISDFIFCRVSLVKVAEKAAKWGFAWRDMPMRKLRSSKK